MTAHNKAQLRYKILDKCFRDTTNEYTFSELLDTVNEMLQKTDIPHKVSERQLYSDIAFMKSEEGFGAVIENYRVTRTNEFGRKRVYSAYRYADPKFSIDKIPLSHEQMRFVYAFISSFDASIDPNIEPWVKKIIARMKEWVGNFNAKPILRYDHHEYQGGTRMKEVYDYFRILMEAIDSQKAVQLYVKNFDEIVFYKLHPFFMKQFINRWFVLGVTTEHPDKVESIPLDKIYSVTKCDDPYIQYPFDHDEYFEDIIGVSDPGGNPVDIHFLAYDWAAYYLNNNPVHSSQRSRWIQEGDQKVLDIHLSVKLNKQLKFTLDKFYHCIKILEPQSLVDQSISSIQTAMKRYGLNGGATPKKIETNNE